MFKKFAYKKDMVRPTVYMFFTRFGIGLLICVLADKLLISDGVRDIKMLANTFISVVFFLLAWVAYLRLDGVRLPKMFMFRFNLKKKPVRAYGDMIDHVDEQPGTSFEELEDNEKDTMILLCDLICAVVFLVLSLL